MENRRLNAIVGAVVVVLIVGGVALLGAFLSGRFKPGYEVDATFARAGQLLRSGSDVKLRGVLVGSVRKIDIADDGTARVTLLLDEAQMIPSNVSAAIRAKTLFGEKYIDLVLPNAPAADELGPGDEIPRDRTIPPIEVEAILEKGVPILEAVDPEKFGAGLHAIAEGLVGNEEALRRATVQSEKLLTETERTLPNLERNLVHLQHFADALNQTDTDLLDALDGLTQVGEAIRENPEAFERTVSGLVPLARDLGDVVQARKTDLADLASKQRPILEAVAEREAKLPELVRLLDSFLGVWVADLSEGPYWRISVTDPPIVIGEPYGPGEAPGPRSASIVPRPIGEDRVRNLIDLLLEPVPPVAAQEAVDSLEPIFGSDVLR